MAPLDRFVTACDVKSPSFQKFAESLSQPVQPVLWRGHSASKMVTADADNQSEVTVFFDDILEPDDESGLAGLWYPKKQDLAEARGANGAVNFFDRKFKISKAETATVRIVYLVDVDRMTGALTNAPSRTQFAEVPRSAKWLIQCSIRW